MLRVFLPWLRWFPISRETLRADLVAGTTVALVLVPQSMAYAQLAGLPPYHGLCAAFLPVIVAALWGSSSQLGTGPTATSSLLTAAVLAPLAVPGSASVVDLAISLALLVGIVRLALGLFRLGAIVNFFSHPVIVGFTNAAAIIIVLSQLGQLLGVSMGRSRHFLLDVLGVIRQIGDTHVPSLLLGVSAIGLMSALKRYAPRAPDVLVAVVLATAVSWAIGFERNSRVGLDRFGDPEVRTILEEFGREEARIELVQGRIAAQAAELRRLERLHPDGTEHMVTLRYQIELLRLELNAADRKNRVRERTLRGYVFARVTGVNGAADRLVLAGQLSKEMKTDGRRWRIGSIRHAEVVLMGGGAVVGDVPRGLPAIVAPRPSWETVRLLLPGAFVIAMVGFLEAISIAKAMAVETGERIDPSQELIGQGLGTLAGSLAQGYPVSGSFSRSALNLRAGARTGMCSVFAGLIVAVTLLFLTPFAYHLPQAVLSAVIFMAVIGLISVRQMTRPWLVHPHDGIAAWVTFLATLAFSPSIENGILAGAGLALILYLYRRMRPRVAILGRHPDGTLRDARLHQLPTGVFVTAVRFDGALYFANVAHFEDAILEAVAASPKARAILVVGDSINELDASGEQVIRRLHRRLGDRGVKLVFSGLKHQVITVLQRTGLYAEMGEERFFRTEDRALDALYKTVPDPSVDRGFHPPGRRSP